MFFIFSLIFLDTVYLIRNSMNKKFNLGKVLKNY